MVTLLVEVEFIPILVFPVIVVFFFILLQNKSALHSEHHLEEMLF